MSILNQAREGRRILINLNPTIITPYRRAPEADGFGGFVPSGALSAQSKVRVRIAHEAGGVQKDSVVASGLGTNLSLFVITDHSLPLNEGDEFTIDNFTYVVGPINTLRIDGGVFGSDAPLTRSEAAPVTIPFDFAAEEDGDTESDVTWSDVGAVNTYSIERKSGTGSFVVVATPTASSTSFHDSALTPETAYTYRMRAFSGSVPSEYTEEKTITTEATP